MTMQAASPAPRYWAFISYSHRDRQWGEWLHRSLETYRVPKALTVAGAPARLFPVFRDREELAGAVNLSARIETALTESRNLIVVCSPRSATSHWVNEELRMFARLGRADRVFALIVDGEPHATDGEQECLPRALRFAPGPNGEPGDQPADYLAADARAEGDGKKNALLKLVAGLIDADYDKLKRRDQERQMRTRATWIGALAVVTLLFAGVAAYALLQRNQALLSAEAERAARQAETEQRQRAEEQRGIAENQRGIAENQRKIAVNQQQIAEEQREIASDRARIAESRRLATEALNQMGTRVDLALLLAVEARRPARTFEAASSMLKVLQSQSGLVKVLHGHAGSVTSVAFSPDGKTIASGGMDSTVRLWSADGEPLTTGPLYTHKRAARDITNDVRVLAFSPDSRLVASGSMNGTLRFGDVVQRRVQEPESEFGGTVSVLTFTPGGLVLTGANGLIVADLVADKVVGEFAIGGRGGFMPDAGAVSPDGTIIAATKMTFPDEGLYLFDATTRQSISEPLADKFPTIEVMRFSPDGTLLAAGDRERSLRVWDVTSRKLLGPPIAGDGIVLDLAFDTKGGNVIWIRSDGSVRRADLKLWKEVGTPTFVGAAASAAFSPDLSTLVLGGADGAVRLWDLAAARHPLGRGIHTWRALRTVAISPDGRHAAIGGEYVELYDLQSGTSVRDLPGNRIFELVFSKDGRRLAFAGEDGAGYYDLVAGPREVVPTTEKQPYNWSIAITPDGRWLAFGGKRLTIWDTVRKAEVPAPQPGKGSVRAVAISPDGTLLAAGADDGTVQTWNLATLKPSGAPLAFGDESWAMAFSPDGTMLAIGGDNGKLQLWNVATRQPVGQPLAHPSRIGSIAFSPDGAVMAVTGSTRIALLYDVGTRRPLGDPLFQSTQYGSISAAAFTPDGQQLVLLDQNQQIFILDGSPDRWAARACRIANRNLTSDEWSRYVTGEPSSATCPAPQTQTVARR